MATVLVTGLSGFTGHYMQRELQGAGHTVTALADSNQRPVPLEDSAAVQHAVQAAAPDYVIHLAAIAFVGHANVNAFYTTNLLGTRNLLAALAGLTTPPKAVLLASSANIYGNATEGLITEDTPPAPANDYAVSKLAMEYMARLFADRLPLIIARPFNYTGAGQASQFLIPKIVHHFAQRLPVLELGNQNVWRDFGDVRAVAQAYRLLLENPAAVGHTVNVCSGTAHALRDVLDLCSSLTDHHPQVRTNPAFVRANEVTRLQGDNTRLKTLIGPWQPPTLADTLAWMLGV